jgi:hypothetical protein
MTDQRVNPELIKAAACMADKTRVWQFDADRRVVNLHPDGRWTHWQRDYFDPLTNDADAMKLERALKKDGWNFREFENGKFSAFKVTWGACDFDEADESDTLLLLRCVSVQTGIALYGEGV